MSNGMLVAHCGGKKVSLEDVMAVKTPERTRTHVPVPHEVFLESVTKGLNYHGFTVERQEFALRGGADDRGNPIPGAQLFGLLELRNGHNHSDYSVVAGIRNSHDKTLSAGLAVGSRVFVCDNMAFSGEITFGRKHTVHILNDLNHVIRENLLKLPAMRNHQEARIEAYKTHRVSDNWVRCFAMRAAESGVLDFGKLKKVWGEWQKPSHEEFAPRTAWSLFNAFTEVMKDYVIQAVPQRTIVLHDLFDKACNVNSVAA